MSHRIGNADIHAIKALLASEHLESACRFERWMGLRFWLPSAVVSMLVGLLLWRSGFAWSYSLQGWAAACALCAIAWAGRLWVAGLLARSRMHVIYELTPWDSLRLACQNEFELTRLHQLEDFMSLPVHRCIEVMPSLLALTAILRRVLHRELA